MSRPTCRIPSTTDEISNTGLSPTMAEVSNSFFYLNSYHIQATPCSLATTYGISVDFFSSGYLDGSVLRVRFSCPMYSDKDTAQNAVGFPIRTSRDHSYIASSPALFAGLHVLRRLSSPRHPPDALIHLTLSFEVPSDFGNPSLTNFIPSGLYFDKAYCLLCIAPAFCVSGTIFDTIITQIRSV